MIYVKPTKDLYGMLRSAMLFYNNFKIHYKEIGFEINPYDPCVVNMMINISQINVCWNIDDLKVYHKEESALDAFVLKICKIFGDSTKVSRGKAHDHMGMDMEW